MKTSDPMAGADAGAAQQAAQAFDRHLQSVAAHLTGGLSPIALGLAYADWAWHLLAAPGAAARLSGAAQSAALQALVSGNAPADGEKVAADPRFAGAGWDRWPYDTLARLHLGAQQWWSDATSLRGVEPHHRDVVHLFARQWLDMLSPSNWPWSNPQVLQATIDNAGENLARGASYAADDWRRARGLPPLGDEGPQYRPGIEVACTPGHVVHRNALVELIRYAPQTATVLREPVFIVPSWIMKYYILDLSPHNSMVRYLVGQGHTVFMLSWRNPDEGDALLDMEDYLHLGIFDPLAAIKHQTGDAAVHAAGYCLGGTLLAVAAAALARPGAVRGAAGIPALKTLTLLAAQVDFREPGDLGILIDEAQVGMLEDMMAERGYLTGPQMAASFQFLHARDLIWSTRMRAYLLGERDAPNDLMAWNADTTRLPAAMHSEYLHTLYLHNDLAEGRYEVEGRPVALGDIRVPIFSVGTVKDHVSPWHSVYKIHRLTQTEVTFVLTNGGHNAGIVSEPGHAGRRYQLHTTGAGDAELPPDEWQAMARSSDGSWWPAWHEWLAAASSGRSRAQGAITTESLAPAPGTYVQVRYDD